MLGRQVTKFAGVHPVTVGGVSPKGLESVAPAGGGTFCTSGGSCVTPNGPLMSWPAPGESSEKNSPRSKYRPNPVRTTKLFLGLHAIPTRGANPNWFPRNLELLVPV